MNDDIDGLLEILDHITTPLMAEERQALGREIEHLREENEELRSLVNACCTPCSEEELAYYERVKAAVQANPNIKFVLSDMGF